VPRAPAQMHAVDSYLRILALLGVPADGTFEWLPPRPEVAAAVRSHWPVNGKRWVVVQPGARWPNKRWPVEKFVQVVQQFPSEDGSVRFAILGGPEDVDPGRTIAAKAPERCLDLTGKLSLPEMVEWIRLSALMLTNDTGPMHVAAALNKPVVALFGPTNPHRTGPYRQLASTLQLSLPCVPCLKPRCTWSEPLACLQALRPELVIEAMRRKLGKGE